MKKQAYVTLLSSKNYIDAVAILALSLQIANSKYPLLVAITEEIFSIELEQLLKNLNCKIKIIKSLEYSLITKKKYNNQAVLNTASKIQIFDFKEWDKLIYLDSDALILKNIDELFKKPDGSMIYIDNQPYGFTGLFIIEPKAHLEKDFYLTLMQHCNVFDGDLLGKLWFFIKNSPNHQIPYYYFQNYTPTNNIDKRIKVIHFCNQPKPWLKPEYKDFDDKYYIAKIYKLYLKEIQKIKNKLGLVI